MDKKRLDEIREFSKKNGEKYGISGEMDFSVDFVMWDEDGESYEIVVPDMWLDSTGRFKLKDEDLVEEWGLENVVNFINECDKYLREKKKMWIDLRVGETGRFVVENCSDEMLVGSEVCVNINKNWEIDNFMSLLTGEVWLKESFDMDVFDSDDRIERIFLSQK